MKEDLGQGKIINTKIILKYYTTFLYIKFITNSSRTAAL